MAMVINGVKPGTKPERMRFKKIETRGIMPNGRVILSSHTYPLGAGYDVYRKLDEGMVRAYGNDRAKTIGTLMDAND